MPFCYVTVKSPCIFRKDGFNYKVAYFNSWIKLLDYTLTLSKECKVCFYGEMQNNLEINFCSNGELYKIKATDDEDACLNM